MFKVLFYKNFNRIPGEHIFIYKGSMFQHDELHECCTRSAHIIFSSVFPAFMEFVPEIAVRVWRV